MFERRVKIFLGILILVTILLIGRAMQVQVLGRDYWRGEAEKAMTAPEFMDTARGSLVDRKGRAIAEDVPCIDACVDFQAIAYDADEKWLRDMAIKRLRARLGDEFTRADIKQRKVWIAEEIPKTREDLNSTWPMLAHVGGKTVAEIDEIRQSVIGKVVMRRRYLWYWKYRRALDQPDKGIPPWYQRLLVDESDNIPEVDQFTMEVPEQTAAHPILRAIDTQTANYLGKNVARLPWLKLQPSVHRHYPYNDVAAHVIGYVGTAQAENVGKNDPYRDDPLRRYEPNDIIGRAGLEALCEPLLRGKRGRVERYYGDGTQRELERVAPVSGLSVQTTIDIELQRDVQEAFRHIALTHRDPEWTDVLDWMPGAAVVIDVPSGEVLAMVSFPTYDLNQVDDRYSKWNSDTVNRPLMNRATQFALEPGSTVKPIVGMGAMTQGVLPVDGTIECTGYMFVNGKAAAQGRCWVASMYEGKIASVSHHPIPYEAAHPTGWLSFPDALERSCNIFFESQAERLGVAALSAWFDKFGLGRPTGVGLPERSGTIPSDWSGDSEPMRQSIWFSGMGQGRVLATPVQMANVAATIARSGTWMRPRLVPAGTEVRPPLAEGPDRIDLHLLPQAIAQAKLGMTRVVSGGAGTGHLRRQDALPVAGKTGSAQAAFLTIPKPKDYTSKENIITLRRKGGEEREVLQLIPGTHGAPSPRAFWYRYTGETEDRRSHAWYIGFAPADNPQVAFAVMVEYGGGGGPVAGQVVNRLLDGCIKHGYLPKR